MKHLGKIIAAGVVFSTALMSPAWADDMASIKAFYSFLSNPGSQAHKEKFMSASSGKWESIGDYSGKAKTRDAFTGQLGGMSKLIPDLKWEIQDIHQAGNVYTVRGRATGTPKGPLFGVDGKGRSFDIMSIDIHTIEDGKIVRSYHVEDWAGALRQLSGK